MAQAIEKLSLKIDDQSLVDGTYRSGHDYESTQPPPQQPSLQLPSQQQPSLHYLQPQQQPPPRRHLQNFQYEDLSDEVELNKPFYQEHDFGDEAYGEGMTYGRGHKKMVNPNPSRRGDFFS